MKTYELRGSIYDADCVIGHSFGTSVDPSSVNAQLASQMTELADGRPMIADRTLVDASPDLNERMAHVVEGPVTNHKAQGVGTWGTLVEAHKYMEEHDLKLALMVAQAHHIGRVVRQATKVGIESVVPAGLPQVFDVNSTQRWTRSERMWVPFNTLGSVLLKFRGEL